MDRLFYVSFGSFYFAPRFVFLRPPALLWPLEGGGGGDAAGGSQARGRRVAVGRELARG